jgi:hypothetical protein
MYSRHVANTNNITQHTRRWLRNILIFQGKSGLHLRITRDDTVGQGAIRSMSSATAFLIIAHFKRAGR